MKPIEEKVIKYQAKDGKIFSSEQKCVDYEKALPKELKCEACNGAGYTEVGYGHDCWGKTETYTNPCILCKGSGIQGKNYKEDKIKYDLYIDLRNYFGED